MSKMLSLGLVEKDEATGCYRPLPPQLALQQLEEVWERVRDADSGNVGGAEMIGGLGGGVGGGAGGMAAAAGGRASRVVAAAAAVGRVDEGRRRRAARVRPVSRAVVGALASAGARQRAVMGGASRVLRF
jgi:hypothetical protein